MRILIWETWASNGSYTDEWGMTTYSYSSTRYYFETTIRDVEPPVTTEPGQSYTSIYAGAPADFVFVGEFWNECVSLAPGDPATTRRGYVHGDTVPFYGTFYTSDIEHATECGWVPPPACTLIIEAVYPGVSSVEIVHSGAVGIVEFSLDGGATWTTATTIYGLDPGTYTIIARDPDVEDCTQTFSFTIEPLPPTPAALPDLSWSQNPILFTALATQPYRRLRIQVYVETEHLSGTYELAFEQEQEAGGAASTTFRIDRDLDALLTREPPNLAQTTPVRLKGRIRRFYVRVREINPATGQPGGYVETDPKAVILGGLPEPMAAEVAFFTGLATSKQFLTWAPRTMRLAAGQTAYLDLLLLDGSLTDFVVRIVVYPFGLPAMDPDDHTTSFLAPGAASLWRIPVKNQYGAAARFTVQVLTTTGTALSEVRTFETERDAARPRLLHFINSLGAIDPICCAGQLTGRQTVERDSVEMLRSPELAAAGAAGFSMARRSGRETLKAGVGWLSPEELDWFRDFFLASHAWEVVVTRLRPLEIITKEYDFYDDNQPLSGPIVEYRHAYPQDHFAASNATTTFNRPPSDPPGDGDDGGDLPGGE